MKIVVTGASGFVGRKTTERFLALGYEVIPVARSPLPYEFASRVSDYADTPEGDVLVHLAGNPIRSVLDNQTDEYLQEVTRLSNCLLNKKYGHIVFASSSAVYGDETATVHRSGGDALATDMYSLSKLDSEQLFLTQSCSVARFSNLYGHGMSEQNVLSSILKQISLGQKVSVRDESPIRDFLWCDDAVDAIVKMATVKPHGIYNIGSGRSVSIGQLVKIATKIAGIEIYKPQLLGSKMSKYSGVYLDVGLAKHCFDWSAKVSLEQGIGMLLDKENTL